MASLLCLGLCVALALYCYMIWDLGQIAAEILIERWVKR